MIRLRIGALLAALATLIGSTTIGARAADETLSVNDPRPLAAAVILIEQRCGCPITYEDPVYTERDTIDIAGTIATRDSRALLVPAGGVFMFTTRLTRGDSDREHVTAAIRDLLQAYALTGYPGQFRLTTSNGVFHVAPERAVLDTPVTVELGRVSASQAIDTILSAVAQGTGAKIGMGGIVSNGLNQQRVILDVSGRPAAEALTSVFVQLSNRTLTVEDHRSVFVEKRLSWQLFYQIGWGYAFNLHGVQ